MSTTTNSVWYEPTDTIPSTSAMTLIKVCVSTWTDTSIESNNPTMYCVSNYYIDESSGS